ncbi:MAG: hypothetical protein H0W11_05570 [Gemmatimonadetes bacterium]|nr:hypothetical protein [Gemmatimonadota bacterium]
MRLTIFGRELRNDLDISIAREALDASRALDIPTYRQWLPRLEAELRRARRYERPLAVLVLSPEIFGTESGSGENGNSALPVPLLLQTAHLVFFLLGSLLCDTMRESDIVTYAAEPHLYMIVLPEAGEAEARQAVRRLGVAFYDRVPVRLRAGIAEFPRDGLTIEDLFGRARNNWHECSSSHCVPALKEVSNA